MNAAKRFQILGILGLTALAWASSCKKADDSKGKKPKADPAPADAPAVAEPDDKPDAPPAPSDEGKIDKPFLWKVTKGDRTGYLLGTMHMGVDAEKTFPQLVWDTLAAADSFCMEANLKDPAAISAVQRTDGKTLDQEMGPELWQKFSDIVGPAAGGFKNMKASAAGAMLAAQGLPMTMPMDLILETKAKGKNMKMSYLEEAMFQLALLDKYIDIDVIRYLVDNLEQMKTSSAEMLAAYLAGDAAKMDEIMNDPEQWKASGGTKAREALLLDRNADWLPKYEKLLAEGTPFCAVGAGHLLGERSLNDLLEKAGYTLERLAP